MFTQNTALSTRVVVELGEDVGGMGEGYVNMKNVKISISLHIFHFAFVLKLVK